MKYWKDVIRSNNLDVFRKTELMLLLAVYFLPILSLLGWIAGIGAYITGEASLPYNFNLFYILPILTYSTVGNFAPFFEIGLAAYLDERSNLLSLLPVLVLNFIVMVFCCTKALLDLVANRNGKHAWSHTNHSGKNNGIDLSDSGLGSIHRNSGLL